MCIDNAYCFIWQIISSIHVADQSGSCFDFNHVMSRYCMSFLFFYQVMVNLFFFLPFLMFSFIIKRIFVLWNLHTSIINRFWSFDTAYVHWNKQVQVVKLYFYMYMKLCNVWFEWIGCKNNEKTPSTFSCNWWQ